MNPITFRAVVGDEQVIRPPGGVVLPCGDLEVSVRVVAPCAGSAPTREAANARLRQHRVSLGYAMGADNEGIDADLARVADESAETP